MDRFKEMVFFSEIALQAKIALRAGKLLNATPNYSDKLEAWSLIQLILGSAANVSKILWSKRFESRSEHLRKLLNIDENNPISKRKLRNHFEHYDERIEKWFEKQPSAVYRDLEINPFESIWGITDKNKNREYNPNTQVLTFRGESIDLGVLLSELEEILLNCKPYTLT